MDSNNSGKLKEFFGENLAKDMFAFGKEMDFVSRTVQGGDLVAANIAASPLQNLGKIARYALLNRILGDRNFYKDVLEKYGKQVGKNVDRRSAFAKAFGSALTAAIPTARQAQLRQLHILKWLVVLIIHRYNLPILIPIILYNEQVFFPNITIVMSRQSE